MAMYDVCCAALSHALMNDKVTGCRYSSGQTQRHASKERERAGMHYVQQWSHMVARHNRSIHGKQYLSAPGLKSPHTCMYELSSRTNSNLSTLQDLSELPHLVSLELHVLQCRPSAWSSVYRTYIAMMPCSAVAGCKQQTPCNARMCRAQVTHQS